MSDTNVIKLAQPGVFTDSLTEVLRSGARALLTQAVEAEVAEFLAKHADLKTGRGQQRVVRHGHLPEREIMTGIGPVAVRQPRVRDREATEGLRPDPVTIGWWTQPALPTPVKQCRPSLTTVLEGWKLRCAKVAISARRKPFTRRNFRRIGLPSGVVSTAATIGVLPGEPRPRLPPLRSPPR